MGAEYYPHCRLVLCCRVCAACCCCLLLSFYPCLYVFTSITVIPLSFPSLYILLCNLSHDLSCALSFPALYACSCNLFPSLFTLPSVIRLCCPLLCRLPCLLFTLPVVISFSLALMKEFHRAALPENFSEKIYEMGLTHPNGGGNLSMVAPHPNGGVTGKAGDHGKQKSIPSDSTGKEVMP